MMNTHKQARAADVPVIFIQEVHQSLMVDFGRKLGGDQVVGALKEYAA